MKNRIPGKACLYNEPGVHGVSVRFPVACFNDSGELFNLSCDLIRPIKIDKKTSVFELGDVVIKKYSWPSRTARFSHFFLRSRALWNYSCSRLLSRHGIATPGIYTALRYTGFLYVRSEILVMERIRDQFVYEMLRDNSFNGRIREFISSLTVFVARLHQLKIVHGDLKVQNIYGCQDGGFGLVDLDAFSVKSRGVPARLRAKELARLATSIELIRPDLKWIYDECHEVYEKCSGVTIPDSLYENEINKFKRHQNRYDKR